MAIETQGFDVSLPVAADYSAAQYKIVDFNSSGYAVITSAIGQAACGILQDDPDAAGRAGSVRISGFSKVIAGAAITKGAWLTSDASARAIPHTANDQFTIGRAITSVSNAGEYVTVQLLFGANPVAYHGSVVTIPIQLATITNGDVVTTWTPGFAGTIEKVSFITTTAATTGGKAADLNLEIGTTNLTGGVISLTSANCTPLGKVVDGTAITAANVFGATDTISVEGSGVTAFVEGAGLLVIVLK